VTWGFPVVRLTGQGGLLVALPIVGRTEEARALAKDTLAAARAYANPCSLVGLRWLPTQMR
jgi:hypothetical protein